MYARFDLFMKTPQGRSPPRQCTELDRYLAIEKGCKFLIEILQTFWNPPPCTTFICVCPAAKLFLIHGTPYALSILDHTVEADTHALPCLWRSSILPHEVSPLQCRFSFGRLVFRSRYIVEAKNSERTYIRSMFCSIRPTGLMKSHPHAQMTMT
jgi:hypothetical protein